MDSGLSDYVAKARSQGMPDDAIRAALLNAGWGAGDVDAAIAMGKSADSADPPVPAPPSGVPPAAAPVGNPLPADNSVRGRSASRSVPLDPVRELFGATWRLYKARFLTLISVIALPVAITGGGIGLIIFGKLPFILLGVVMIVGGLLISIAAGAAMIIALHENAGFAESYQRGVGLSWFYFSAGLLAMLAVAGGYVMLVVPGILMGVWFSFTAFTVVIDGRRGIGALTQSRAYTKGYWWAIVGRMLLIGVIVWLLFWPVSWLISSLFGQTVATIVVEALEVLIVSPFVFAYQYSIYRNLSALRPYLAEAPATSGKVFFVVSIVIGVLAPIVALVVAVSAATLILSSIFKSLSTRSTLPPQPPLNMLTPTSVQPLAGATYSGSCGDNDLNCFIAAARTCSPASVEWSHAVNFLSVITQTTQTHLALGGSDGVGACAFSDRIDNVQLAVTPQAEAQAKAQGATDAQIQTQMQVSNAQAQQSVGITLRCSLTTSSLVQMLTNWAGENYNSSELASGNCTATNASGTQIQFVSNSGTVTQ